MIPRDDASQRQILAADPGGSTWLSANAGSGKTRVLTDRVARLLLADVDPQKILCLTYTKAAASEMQNRLFQRLGEWAMEPDRSLAQKLAQLGVEGSVNADKLRKARTLFARAIETPGGLKIQTIHSFCASLLRRFPLEAGVTPQFIEMDDRAAKRLREDIVEDMAAGADVGVVDGLAREYTGDDLDSLTAEIARNRDRFGFVSADDLRSLFGLNPDLTQTQLGARTFAPGDNQILTQLIAALRQGSINDIKAADKLAALDPGNLTLVSLPVLEDVFLTGKGAKDPFTAKLGSFPTKATRAALQEIIPALEGFMTRVEDARVQRIALAAFHRTWALHEFGRVFLGHYAQEKLVRGWLDFDDLILKARDLLNDPAVAAWVLYRLDGGIDHILVDEAQDTSPAQWEVVERLTQEFTSGQGARDVARTIFVVGDKKQSIYSFQGADPDGFDRMGTSFGKKLSQVGAPFSQSELLHSFRSSSAILTVVDRTLGDTAGIGRSQHAPFWQDLPGRVDLWPPVPKADDPEDGDWFDPVDRIAENHHHVVLARKIAAEIRRLLDAQTPLPRQTSDGTTARSVQPGDFLILVQRRSELFHEIIRACKEAGLDIAGADRLKIGAELAVRDLTALLAFLSLPEDDLSLAAALKSPLFGWNEQALFDLAHRRDKGVYLWQALRDRAADFPQTTAILDDLRRMADFLRPYDLIERILTRHKGREALLARLGLEAEDGIDALLSQAMGYERIDVPSLTGFLSWLETDEVEIKRQMDSAGNRIRVMTVHGAKGLEAPIVILPDCAQRTVSIRDELLPANDTLIWKSGADQSPRITSTLRDTLKSRQEEERQRLLYVAMTRAENWLIVCAAGDLGKDGQSWHDQIAGGMGQAGGVETDSPTGRGMRYSVGEWPKVVTQTGADAAAVAQKLPEWVTVDAPPPPEAPVVRSPSDLGGLKALGGAGALDDEAAMRRGSQIHRLLEVLSDHPAEDWPAIAQRLLSVGDLAADPSEVPDLMAEAARVLQSPDFATIFGPGTLAEVEITAHLPQIGARIHGAIDRLIVTPDTVLAIDFKSNATPPDDPAATPEGILRQMGAYSAALTQIYPDRAIETAILWTRTANLMRLPHDAVMKALERAASA